MSKPLAISISEVTLPDGEFGASMAGYLVCIVVEGGFYYIKCKGSVNGCTRVIVLVRKRKAVIYPYNATTIKSLPALEPETKKTFWQKAFGAGKSLAKGTLSTSKKALKLAHKGLKKL